MSRNSLRVLLLTVVATALAGADAHGQAITVQRLEGDVSVRHGVTEVWTQVAAGDVLKPDDTMRIGKRGSALLVAQMEGATAARILLPPEVIVDLSDIRQLTPEELMLKLTMEKVRSSSYQWKNEELHIPNAAVVHGEDRSAGAASTIAAAPQENDLQTGTLVFNGTRVLYDNGFYSTCALRALEAFRRYPAIASRFDNHLLLAQALERANLRGEALHEYGVLAGTQGLSAEQQALIHARMDQLRK